MRFDLAKRTIHDPRARRFLELNLQLHLVDVPNAKYSGISGHDIDRRYARKFEPAPR